MCVCVYIHGPPDILCVCLCVGSLLPLIVSSKAGRGSWVFVLRNQMLIRLLQVTTLATVSIEMCHERHSYNTWGEMCSQNKAFSVMELIHLHVHYSLFGSITLPFHEAFVSCISLCSSLWGKHEGSVSASFNQSINQISHMYVHVRNSSTRRKRECWFIFSAEDPRVLVHIGEHWPTGWTSALSRQDRPEQATHIRKQLRLSHGFDLSIFSYEQWVKWCCNVKGVTIKVPFSNMLLCFLPLSTQHQTRDTLTTSEHREARYFSQELVETKTE